VGIVDLRGREEEPAVAALLAADKLEDGFLVGWEDEDGLVACARLVRHSAEEVRLGPLMVIPAANRAAVGPALVNALAAMANATRLEAEAEEQDLFWLERCGFNVDGYLEGGRVRCIRNLTPTAAPSEAVVATSLVDVERAIADAWGRDTSDNPNEWSEENAARGQCDVTALVVRDLLGGDILIANVLRNGKRVERHAWNRLPSGLALDLTRTQFREGETFEEPTVQEPLAIAASPKRYELLARRVRAALRVEHGS